MFSKWKIRTKILASVLSIVFMTLLITIGFVTLKVREMTLNEAYDKAEEITYRYSGGIKSELEIALDASRTLSDVFEGMKNACAVDRDLFNDVLKMTLINNADLFTGVWSCWEPDMLDGKDGDFIDKAGHDRTGRFVPYWTMKNGSPALAPLVGYETPGDGDYYLLPKKSKKEVITEPYYYSENGNVLITSLVTPIVMDGNFMGVVGVDLNLKACTDMLEDVHPFKTGYTALLSNEANYIVAPEKSRIGKKLEHEEAMKPIKEGSFFTMTSRSIKTGEDVYRVFVPIQVGHTTTPWSLQLAISAKAILADSDKMTFYTSIIGVIALIILTIMVFLVVGKIVKPISAISDTLIRISDQDLTDDPSKEWLTIYKDSGDEIGDMYRSLLTMKQSFTSLLRNIQEAMEINGNSAESLAALSEESSASITEISVAIERVADLSESNSAALEESNAAIEEIANGAQSSAQTSADGATEANRTKENTVNTVTQIEEMISEINLAEQNTKREEENVRALSESVKEISGFVDIITNIADQTNLLALNAAIEAARAGDAGRGFAVVADEVRKLAEESNRAALQVSSLIATLRDNAKKSMEVTGESREIMKETVKKAGHTHDHLAAMLEAIEKIEAMIHDIASVAEEQAASSEEMASSIEQATDQTMKVVEMVNDIRNSSTESSQVSEQVANEAQEMLKNTDQVQRLLSQFKIESAKDKTGLAELK